VIGGLEDFLREFSLATREGLALMVLAEALLRVPDPATQDRLIEDKLAGGDWSDRGEHAETWLVLASTWALGLSSRPGPAGRDARRHHFRPGPAGRQARGAHRHPPGHARHGASTSCSAKPSRKRSAGRGLRKRAGYRYSYDMLGEGARTAADAERYCEAYSSAIAAIGAAAGGRRLPDRPESRSSCRRSTRATRR
jgi:RHH-type proline utilization regulon transcriptional repressor/proline dehydrogenase/delta 1-pyrroline-5-carboxylate dehydrogenase